MSITPDTKDWTWVLERRCPECGYDATRSSRADLAPMTRSTVARWPVVLARPGVTERYEPGVWSALEYACHVRDVYLLFAQRVRLMLDEDDPLFANWDQDETAVASDYGSQDPKVVERELVEAGDALAALFASIPVDDDARWTRPGRRSDGSVFTVESIGRYFLHDVVHHLHDVKAG